MQDMFVFAPYTVADGACSVEIRFDMEKGREHLADIFDLVAGRPPHDASGMDLLCMNPELDARQLRIYQRPWEPISALPDNAFVEHQGGCAGITLAQSRQLIADFTRAHVITAERKPVLEFLLDPDAALPAVGLTARQALEVKGRILGHTAPCGFAEWDPDGTLWIFADKFVLQLLRDALFHGMGRSPVVNMQECMCIVPDVRFCFVRYTNKPSRLPVLGLEFTGHYTGQDNAIENLQQYLSNPLYQDSALVRAV